MEDSLVISDTLVWNDRDIQEKIQAYFSPLNIYLDLEYKVLVNKQLDRIQKKKARQGLTLDTNTKLKLNRHRSLSKKWLKNYQ